MNAANSKILVLRFSSMGDVVLATPVFRTLRRLYPEARISAAVKKEYAALVACHPCVDEVLAFEPRGRHRGFFGLLAFARAVRAGHFGLVVDLHGNFRSRLVCFLSGARVLRSSKAWLKRRLLVWLKIRPGAPVPHAARRYLDCLKPLIPQGFRPEDARPDLRPAPSDEVWAGSFLKNNRALGGRRWVGIFPGAAWPTKRWPSKKFSELMDRLASAAKTNFMVFGGPDDMPVCREVIRHLKKAGGGRVRLCAGRTSPGQLAALLKRCRVLVTNDSGPMHVAVGVGVPVVAFFGPTVRDFGFSPLGPRDQVLEKPLGCRPCTLHGSNRCPILTHECLEGITSESACQAVKKRLKEPKS